MQPSREAGVVVTGIGAVVSGVDTPADLLGTGLDTSGDPLRGVRDRALRHKDRATKLALRAARAALADAGLDGTGPCDRTGVVASSNFGNVDTVCRTVDTIAEGSYLAGSPMLLPSTASNVVASWLAIVHGLRGANLTLCNGATSGLDAVHWARLLVRRGRVDRVLVAGVEPANEVVTGMVETMLPGGGRDTRLLDGAAALVVESAESARRRGAEPLATVGRYVRTADHETAVREAGTGTDRPFGLWCVPEGAPQENTISAGVRVHDLAATLGRCSGALGVLQCVAGVAWLRAGADRSVLATAGLGDPAGAGRDDAAAALVLTPAGGRP